MKIKDKVFVVTGAGSGVGRELTKQLVSGGAKVAMVDINLPGMEETASIAGKEFVSIHPANIADRSSVEKLPEDILNKHGKVDGLINNAGIIQPFVDILDLEYEGIERIMNVNFYGTLYMTKTFLPFLLEQEEGHIVNISSMGGFIPFPGQTMYSASKAAVKILTEGLFAELRDTNVGVTVVHPGAIDTNIMSNSGVQSRHAADASKTGQTIKMLSPHKAAGMIIHAIEKNQYRLVIGTDAKMLDVLYRIYPKKAVTMIEKQMSDIVH
jgi:short-subunit dehydrogenase